MTLGARTHLGGAGPKEGGPVRRYLAVRPEADGTRTRLLCFHHAGAGALSYAGWRRRVGPGVTVLPVRLPGRETRLREPRITDAGRLMEELQADLGPLLDAPHAFYGHSMGALVAYRFALHRAEARLRPPVLLLAGACAAPQLPSALLDRPGLESLTDEELTRVMPEEESMPEALRARPALLRATLDTLRADLLLARSLRAAPVRRLPCSVRAYAGRDDRVVTVGQVSAWKQCSGGDFRLSTVPGAHFFVRGRDVPRAVGRALRSATPVTTG
ncbi:thioesterase [Streptomyces gancidicus BKS 13-15]|uniref:Thioesterase n=1 Tax=Streptomyces gancidicus BKS 13-15 TaxID=1284664 RepID=M3EAL2_STREZ|nr:alpha/beta fold hydrolase [Streptomyces gancidicus]EMF30186.1 thioesterase [Streptomyces gancidicus BKS 13-15]